MIPFKTVTLCDKPWVDEIVFAEGSPSADYNFGNIYISDSIPIISTQSVGVLNPPRETKELRQFNDLCLVG